MFVLFYQSPHVHSLEQTKADLMESMGESRKRKDEIEVSSCFLLQMSFPSCEYVQVHLKVLNGKLRSEKAECAALQARFLYPNVFSEEKRFEEIKNALFE